MIQPIFKNSKGKYSTYGETSKKDLIRICYIFSKEAQNFLRGMEHFKQKYTSVILLHGTTCPKCADYWSEYGEVTCNNDSEIHELEDK